MSDKNENSSTNSPTTEAHQILADLRQVKSQAEEALQAIRTTQTEISTIVGAAKTVVGEINGDRTESAKCIVDIRSALATSSQLADRLKVGTTQAEEQLTAIASLRKAADDHATYAFQAKINTEAHAKATSVAKGQAEGDSATITANKQKSEELVQAITVGKANSDADVKIIAGSRKSIEESTQSIIDAADQGKARLEEVREAKTAVVDARKETESMRDAVIQARNKVENAMTEASQFSEKANAASIEATRLRDLSSQSADQVKTILAAAKASEDSLKSILEHLKKSDDIATGHEQRVSKLSQDLEALIQKVESLLPGATSAGLASAFNAQKQRFGSPQRRWLWTFVICMCLLVAVSLPSFIHAATGDVAADWGVIFRGFAMRLPIIIPLVWLAIYAGRNYMLSLRLEEDYAYKEAISTAFEGYKREMEKIIPGDANNPTPLTTLCINILRAIADRPGRIYEGKPEDITVFNEVKTVVQKADELRQKAVAS